MSDANILHDVITAEDGSAEAPGRRNGDVLFDRDLPALVRGFIALNQGPATETMAIREAGFMPRLYATYQGRRVRVTMVSRLGDVGISHKDEEYGYFTRCSIYDLTEFSDEMSLSGPANRPRLTFYTLVDAKGRWVDEAPIEGGNKTASRAVSAPRLFVERSTAGTVRHTLDPFGLKGFVVIPIHLTKVPV